MTKVLEGEPPIGADNQAVAEAAVRLVSVRKEFGDAVALHKIDLEIADGEFFSLLGPSGSGKTTCLRLIAGFDEPTSGRVVLQGRDVTDLPPYDRDVNTVFQDYALFPHMTVEENVGYGLKVKGVRGKEKADRVAEALRMVRLGSFGARKPAALSGGQRQRVALARALVNHPKVLLLDEPLGALDLKLRQQMQMELKTIQQRVGITFIYVTHDQEEALTMSDRLGVMNDGRLEQIGSPRDVYERPESEFVAGFVGVSNVLPREEARELVGIDAVITVRPENIRILESSEPARTGEIEVRGRVSDVVFLGSHTRVVVEAASGTRLLVTRPNDDPPASVDTELTGRDVRVAWDRSHSRTVGEATSSGNDEVPEEGGA